MPKQATITESFAIRRTTRSTAVKPTVIEQRAPSPATPTKRKLNSAPKKETPKKKIKAQDKNQINALLKSAERKLELSEPTVTTEPTISSYDRFKDLLTDRNHKTCNLTVAESVPAIPAYEKHQDLLLEKPLLTLPQQYSKLFQSFTNCDDCSSQWYNRSELVTFSKLQKAVELASRNTFNEHVLGQILHVKPAFYTVRWRRASLGPEPSLIITPNLNDVSQLNDKSAMNFSVKELLSRKLEFKTELLRITYGYHQKFLKDMKSKLASRSFDLTNKWHAKFKADELCDEIPSAALPEKPVIGLKTGEQFVNAKLKDIGKTVNQRIDVALAKIPPPQPCHSPQLKGLNSALLEKIRARTERNHAEQALRGPDASAARSQSQLPQLVRIIRSAFMSTGALMPKKRLFDIVRRSTPFTVEQADWQRALAQLEEKAPGWLVDVNVGGQMQVKLDPSRSLKDVLEQLQRSS